MTTLTKLIRESGIQEYQCVKKVRALKITKRDHFKVWVEGQEDPIEVPATMMVRFIPSAGDYLVIYSDDYASFSPKNVFEEGYVRI